MPINKYNVRYGMKNVAEVDKYVFKGATCRSRYINPFFVEHI